MNVRFTITLTHHHWACGDGCCSDSGYKLYVEDLHPEVMGYGCVTENNDWDSNRGINHLLIQAIECIESLIKHPPIKGVDYTIIEDDEYDE